MLDGETVGEAQGVPPLMCQNDVQDKPMVLLEVQDHDGEHTAEAGPQKHRGLHSKEAAAVGRACGSDGKAQATTKDADRMVLQSKTQGTPRIHLR